jgi:hypothetical protein
VDGKDRQAGRKRRKNKLIKGVKKRTKDREREQNKKIH